MRTRSLKTCPATDEGGGDIVEEGGDHEDQGKKHKSAPPIIRENGRHPIGNAACLEMAGKERKADEKQKQIGKQDPFMGEMGEEAGELGAFVETVRKQFLDDDGAETGEGYRERVAVKNGDARQRDAKQQKIGHHGRIVSAGGRCDGHAEDPAARITRSLHIREMPSAAKKAAPRVASGQRPGSIGSGIQLS